MKRTLIFGVALLLAEGCQLPPEKVAVMPFPEEGKPVPYGDLVLRARLQAQAATEAFYVDRWADLEEAAKALEQSARFLPKSTDVPDDKKKDLPAKADQLGKEATQLMDLAKAQKVKESNETLQRINLLVRDLRPAK